MFRILQTPRIWYFVCIFVFKLVIVITTTTENLNQTIRSTTSETTTDLKNLPKKHQSIRRRSPLPQSKYLDYGNNNFLDGSEIEAEKLKVQLLENLNKYSNKGPERDALAPIESDSNFGVGADGVANAASILNLGPRKVQESPSQPIQPFYSNSPNYDSSPYNSNPIPNFLDFFGTTSIPQLTLPTLPPFLPQLFPLNQPPNPLETTTTTAQPPLFGQIPWFLPTPPPPPPISVNPFPDPLIEQNLLQGSTSSFVNKISNGIYKTQKAERFTDNHGSINAAAAIRNWRTKMYKLFHATQKNNTVPLATDEASKFGIEQNSDENPPTNESPYPRRYITSNNNKGKKKQQDNNKSEGLSPANQYIIIAPENRFPKKSNQNKNNPEVLLLLRSDSKDWIPERIDSFETKKAVRLAKLFGVEHNIQNNATTTTDNYPYPDSSTEKVFKQNKGLQQETEAGIFVRAGMPIIAIPAFYPTLPPPVPPTVESPQIQPATTQNPIPLLSEFAYGSTPSHLSFLNPQFPTTTNAPIAHSRPPEYYMKELENLDYDTVDESKNGFLCRKALQKIKQKQSGCRSEQFLDPELAQQQQEVQANQVQDGDQQIEDNMEMCNSQRLNRLIKETVILNDAEASKRAIQMRAEAEFGGFYNVICGTGFFSYIAHTDEFCLASVGNLNCYVFSPVCNLRLRIASGIAATRAASKRQAKSRNRNKTFYRQQKSYLNRN